MDSLSHVLYGVTCCSRRGLPGGQSGPIKGDGSPRRFDWTAWAAAAFGILPDALSLGLYFSWLLIQGKPIDWHGIPTIIFALYWMTHSLVVAGLCILLFRVLWKPLVLPACAWPLHIAMDTFTHQQGRFQTPILFPVSDFRLHGINWWEHTSVIYTYWGILLAIWISLAVIRWRYWSRRMSSSSVKPSVGI